MFTKVVLPQGAAAEEARDQHIQEVLDALIKRSNRPENVHGQGYAYFRTCDLDDFSLTEYLSDERIDKEVAKEACREACFYQNNWSRRTIAFENVAGGYTLRSSCFKGYYGPKTVSWIRHQEWPDTCMIFEDFMDYLAFLTLIKQGDSIVEGKEGFDAVVLNQVDLEQTSVIDLLNLYDNIECFCGDGESGMKTFRHIRKRCLSRVRDAMDNNIRVYLEEHSKEQVRRHRGMHR